MSLIKGRVMTNELKDLLKDCTVRVKATRNEGMNEEKGIGFFVAKNTILTAYHVVEKADSIKIIWKDRDPTKAILSNVYEDKNNHDFAVLIIKENEKFKNHPCVLCGNEDPEYAHKYHSWIYNDDNYDDYDNCNIEKAPKLIDYKFNAYSSKTKIMQFSTDPLTIERGYSGAPIFNSDTGKVCGYLVSRDQKYLGFGYHISALFEKIKEEHDKFHENDTRWIKLLPDKVVKTEEGYVKDSQNDKVIKFSTAIIIIGAIIVGIFVLIGNIYIVHVNKPNEKPVINNIHLESKGQNSPNIYAPYGKVINGDRKNEE